MRDTGTFGPRKQQERQADRAATPARTVYGLQRGRTGAADTFASEVTIASLLPSFTLTLRAANRSPATITSYQDAVKALVAFLTAQGMPLTLGALSREHIEAFIADLFISYADRTVATRWRGLQQFFRWCIEADELAVSPMARMREPQVGEVVRTVLSDDQLRALFAACGGKDFAARRDLAMLRILVDTGLRRAEIAGICLPDIDLAAGQIVVHGKGNRARRVHIGARTLKALDAYLRMRRQHPNAERLDALWLNLAFGNRSGALSASSIKDIVKRRAKEAGLDINVFPHLFRHTFAHRWLDAGGQEGSLRELGGWRSDVMRLYGASLRAERAIREHERLAPGDNL